MKRLYQFKNIALISLMALGATSCEDWLTLYPQDRVVEENFWEDKNDLEGVRYAAYSQMAGTIEKMIIWGDLRSDSYQLNSDFTTSSDGKGTAAKNTHDLYKKVVEAQLDSTMSFYDWGSVYTTINFCNKVLQHGPEVLAHDAQFTNLEWQEMKAEVTALRALNYFYLIRAFKDIPYSTRVINSDEEVIDFPLSNGLNVLDTLIADVRSVAGQGRNRFAVASDTHGMMTNTSIYALLAEMYLWRSALREGRSGENVIGASSANDSTTTQGGFTEAQYKSDCDSVVYYGQLSLDALASQNELSMTGGLDRFSSRTKNYGAGIPNSELLSNESMSSSYESGASPAVSSYTAIFNSGINGQGGNSSESMFEMQFNESDDRKNGTVAHFWGAPTQNNCHLSVSNTSILNIYGSSQDKMNKDSRNWYSCSNLMSTSIRPLAGYYMFKWMNCSFQNNNKTISTQTSSTDWSHWIFYRQTDVMLMMAEAYAVLGEFNKCKSIVDAIHKRSTVGEVAADGASNNKANCIKLVMNERQIELLGEGKRWFDLVRYAERIGGGVNPDVREPQYFDGTKGVQEMITEYLAKSNSELKDTYNHRIKNRYGLYCPIYYMELKASHGQMVQNPVWNREK